MSWQVDCCCQYIFHEYKFWCRQILPDFLQWSSLKFNANTFCKLSWQVQFNANTFLQAFLMLAHFATCLKKQGCWGKHLFSPNILTDVQFCVNLHLRNTEFWALCCGKKKKVFWFKVGSAVFLVSLYYKFTYLLCVEKIQELTPSTTK